MNNYLESVTSNAIDAMQYQIDKWRADGVDITREVIDNTIDQYYDDITGNQYGATPTRIYTDEAKPFFEANADETALYEWTKDGDMLEILAKAYAEGNYNALDVLESIRVYDTNRDAVVDAVCKYYEAAEGVNHE